MTVINQTNQVANNEVEVKVDVPAVAETETQVASEPGTVASKRIFDEIMSADYKLPEGRKKHRGHFIDRAVAEAGMTARGAGTYFTNFTNEAKGLPRYFSSYSAERKKAILSQMQNPLIELDDEVVATAPVIESVKVAEVAEEVVGERWMVLNEDGSEHSSFSTRAGAMMAARELNLKWADRTKAA